MGDEARHASLREDDDITFTAGLFYLGFDERVMASGVTFSGVPFTREQTLTAAAFAGGDQPLPTTPPKDRSPLCCIIESLTEVDSVRRLLDQHGINAAEIRKAIGRCCADQGL